MRNFPQILTVLAVFLSAVSADQLLVLRKPESIELRGESYLTPEAVEDVMSASLGYSVPSDDSGNWDGLVISDPFSLARGLLSVVVEGLDSLSFKDAASFDVLGSGDPFTGVVKNVQGHLGKTIDLDLKTKIDLETAFGTIQPATQRDVEYLKPKSTKADQDLLNQIAIIDGLTALFKQDLKDIPTATVVRTSLTAFLKEHDSGSQANAEGMKLLRSAITDLTATMDPAFKGRVLVTVLATADTVHSRSKRETDPKASATELNIVDGYDSDYPVIFNIVLWFSIIMLLTLVAISYAIGNMDPGRDSIIYRMTSTRMKKDN
jgi:renin receptor